MRLYTTIFMLLIGFIMVGIALNLPIHYTDFERAILFISAIALIVLSIPAGIIGEKGE